MVDLSFVKNSVEKAMKKAKAPGAAVTIVKDGNTVFCEGFGLRELEKSLPVTLSTKFLICSLTKSFTSLSSMLLVQEGRLDLDEPIGKYMPGFSLFDSYASNNCTLRDFLTHMSGLPGHDALWLYNPSKSRGELVQNIAFLEPSAKLRSKWQYNNLGYTLAGHIVEEITGKLWEDFMDERILNPLEISGDFCSSNDSSGDYAVPYEMDHNNFKTVSCCCCSAMGPAGTSLRCSIADIAKWMQFNLSTGDINGVKLLDETHFREMHHGFTLVPKTSNPSSKYIKNKSYFLGWFREIYQGHLHLYHDGGYPGFSSFISLFPEQGLGIGVLSNSTSSLPEVIALSAAEAILGLERLHSSKDIWAMHDDSTVPALFYIQDKLKMKPVRSLINYIGEYSHRAYGILSVKVEKDKLLVIYNEHIIELEHLDNESFIGVSFSPGRQSQIFGIISFSSNSYNAINKVNVPFEPAVKPIEFIKLQ